MKKLEFATYLNEQLINHQISELKLSKELGIAQKSINRYRNAVTNPSEEVKERIRSYFVELDRLKQKEMQYEKSYVAMKNYYERLADNEKLVRCISMKKADEIAFLKLFWAIDEDDCTFLRLFKELRDGRKKKLMNYLEGILISYEMISVKKDVFLRDKNRMLLQHVQDLALSQNEEKKEIEENKNPSKTKKEMEKIIKQSVIFHMRYSDSVPNEFSEEEMDRLLSLTIYEWYSLYLYNRLKLADRETADTCAVKMIDGKIIGEREYLMWMYMEALLHEKETKKQDD